MTRYFIRCGGPKVAILGFLTILIVSMLFLYRATKPYTVRLVTGHVTPVTPVDFRIIVIVYNRAKSLQECLESLNTVDYMGDKVALDVWIDRSKTGVIDGATFTVAKNFRFKGGDVIVHNQTKHVGILGQWMDSWQVKPDTKEIAVILEDDMSAGPFMWKWLKVGLFSIFCAIYSVFSLATRLR